MNHYKKRTSHLLFILCLFGSTLLSEQIQAQAFNILNGKIFTDLDGNCALDTDEVGLVNWTIKASTAGVIYYGNTDQDGNYLIGLPPGDFVVTIHPPAALWDLCEDTYNISFLGVDETQTLNIPAATIIECPVMTVFVGNPWDLRICEGSQYYVNYCNAGTQIAEDVSIEIMLDEFQTLLTASIPVTSQMNNILTFDVEDLAPGECGDFTFEIELACDTSIVGFTHCVEAYIFPDSICVDTAMWSGASLEVMGTCENGAVNFSAKNIGTATTTPTLDFIVIEDQVIYMQGNIDDLAPDTEQALVSIPANGKTYRIQLEQEEGHPGLSMPTTFIEGCRENSNQSFSTGFVNFFPPDDANNFIDIACAENGYPYDPNDKLAVPYGYGEEHYIFANQAIEYTIRFQNTGTAAANNVVIRDFLPSTLDPTTLRHGASSHPYTYELLGNGEAVFTFENINLPDSTTNLAGSQGFIKFDIQQQPNLPAGTLIENRAFIFFDLAAAVITDTWFHTVEEDFIIINSVNDKFKTLTINAVPNPFTDYTNIVLEGMNFPNAELILFDAFGKVVESKKFENNQIQISRTGLASGIYFFNIQSKGQFVGSGKLMVQ